MSIYKYSQLIRLEFDFLLKIERTCLLKPSEWSKVLEFLHKKDK